MVRNHAALGAGLGCAVLGALLGLAGCDAPDSPAPTPIDITCDPGEIDRPQAVTWLGDRLVVANSGFGDPWRAGRLTLFDMQGQRLTSRPTRWLNPQTIQADGDGLWVVGSGAFDLTTAVPRVRTNGGVERLDSDLRPVWSAALPAVLGAGGPIGFALHRDRAVIGSGVQATAYVLDFESESFTRSVENPVRFGPGLGLGAPVAYGDRTLIVDYNADRLIVLDPDDTPWACTLPLGVPDQDVLAGAKSPLIVDDTLYYLLDGPGLLQRLDLGQLPAQDPGEGCDALPRETLWVTGQLPNHVSVANDRMYVVQSGDNNVIALDIDSFEPVARYALPPGSNPWAAAVHRDGAVMAVTEWLSDAVSIINLTDGTITRIQCGDTAPVPSLDPSPRPASVMLADEVLSAPTASDALSKDPRAATNGVRGAGDQAGSRDVYSISVQPEDHLAVCWSSGRARDDAGDDVVVFENPFQSGDMTFMDLVVVEASPDGERWVAFPHAYLHDAPADYVPKPAEWQGFAGRTPVRLNDDDAIADPFDTAFAGGDAFDFADLPGPIGDAIRAEGARCIRLRPAAAQIDPNTGALYPKDPVSDGPDIDGVYGRRVE